MYQQAGGGRVITSCKMTMVGDDGVWTTFDDLRSITVWNNGEWVMLHVDYIMIEIPLHMD